MSECETCLCESMYSKAEKNDYHHALLASRDAEIARLRAALKDVIDTEGCGCCEAMNCDASVPNTSKNDHGTAVAEARRALKEEP